MKKFNSIFLIDDSETVNAINKLLLSSMNIAEELKVFSSATKALDELNNINDSESLPDIIFLDLEMPEINGFEFLDIFSEKIETMNTEKRIIVAFLSAHLDFENFSKTKYYKELFTIDHIRKPMDEEDVTNLIDEHFS